MRYYKGYIALSDTCDVPVLLQVRNSRAITFDQLRDLLAHEMLEAIVRSLRWRVTRLEKVGLIERLNGQRFLGKPVYAKHVCVAPEFAGCTKTLRAGDTPRPFYCHLVFGC